MEIDLTKVLAYSKDCLQSRAQMRSIMMDMYPGKTRDMNVLLAIYDTGIPQKIASKGIIDEIQYAGYVSQIVNDYAMNEKDAIEGLNEWIKLYLPDNNSKYNYHINNEGIKAERPVVYEKSNEENESLKKNTVVTTIGKASEYRIREVRSGNIEIVKFLGFEQKDLILPNTIEGKKVVGIGRAAFYGCDFVNKIVLSEGIQYIEDCAFANCTNLEQIILPDSLERIGSDHTNTPINSPYEFDKIYSPEFEKTIIQNSIGAFAGTSLHEIILSLNVTFIGEQSFFGCGKLHEIQIPKGVKHIKKFSFCRCNSLDNVYLNEGLLKIEDRAFQNCKNLKRILIPSSVADLGNGIFDIEDIYVFQRKRGYYIKAKKNTDIIVFCYAGTPAIEYARNEGYRIDDATKIRR